MKALELDRYFQPFQSIRAEDGSRFIGRRDAVVRITAQLQGSGGALAVVGDRGVGKTSLGWRLFEILSGDRTWLKKNNISIPKNLREFTTVWVECTPAHENLLGLILAILKPREDDISSQNMSLSEEFLDALADSKVSERVDEIIDPAEAQAFKERLRQSYEDEFSEKLKPFIESIVTDKNALYALFREVISKVAEKTQKKIFIFLDEMDRLPDKTGVGDFIKTGRDVRFCSIGVSKDINEFILDHPSSERKIITYLVQPLSANEVAEIFALANKRLTKDGFRVEFDGQYIDLASRYSGGFPYFAQRLGYEALVDLTTEDNDDYTFSSKDFYKNMLQILQPDVDHLGRHRKIKKAIQQKNNLEILTFVSKHDKLWVPIALVREHSSYRFVANLASLEGDGILESAGGQVRFSDPYLRAITLAFDDPGFMEYSL